MPRTGIAASSTRPTMASCLGLRVFKYVGVSRRVMLGRWCGLMRTVVVFPQGIPVTLLDGKPGETHDVGRVKRLPVQPPRDELGAPSTKAKGGLSSEAGVIKVQARQVKPLHDGENLLKVRLSHKSKEPGI